MKEKELAPNFNIPSSNNKEFELKKNKNKFGLYIVFDCNQSVITMISNSCN